MVVGAIEQLHAKTLPVPATPKPDAPPQGEGGTERPLAGCPFPQRRKEVSEARGPSLYVGDSSFQAWFPQEERQFMEKCWKNWNNWVWKTRNSYIPTRILRNLEQKKITWGDSLILFVATFKYVGERS